jgi:hypothetical protein
MVQEGGRVAPTTTLLAFGEEGSRARISVIVTVPPTVKVSPELRPALGGALPVLVEDVDGIRVPSRFGCSRWDYRSAG